MPPPVEYILELVRAEEMLTDDPHGIWASFAVAFDRFTEWDTGDMPNSGNSPEFVYSKPISNFLNPYGKSSNHTFYSRSGSAQPKTRKWCHKPKRHHGDKEEKTWEFHHVRGTTNKHTHMLHVTLSRV